MLVAAARLEDREIAHAVQVSHSLSETVYVLKRAKVGSNFQLVRRVIERLGLDTTHWTRRERCPLDRTTLFVQNGRQPRKALRRVILQEHLIPYRCALCDSEPVWQGKPLVLRLDHRNGVRNDDRLDNLRFLCPNCDSQTDTFCGRNRPKGKDLKHRCLDCPAMTTGERCRSCCSKHRHRLNPQPTKITWPPLPQLQAALQASNMLTVARSLGVSDNALRKHLRREYPVVFGA
jgi:hypothetical protein